MTRDSQHRTVPRPPEDPTPDDVYEYMADGRCYVVADLVEEFSDTDASRWTLQNRLDELAEEGRIEKRKHANERVTYRRPD